MNKCEKEAYDCIKTNHRLRSNAKKACDIAKGKSFTMLDVYGLANMMPDIDIDSKGLICYIGYSEREL